ncbi:hypothetical protein O181_056036 [Austropuccinia psidii MF-1]|uniref:Uncharacterized protein n=1 Tax=Austropuccinia psidii MF-1 TaxID=1389203 RepID=A0A9Q3ECI0_9BASI|nr:hypothetical protein [Austropuccinia psidii MF-1]
MSPTQSRKNGKPRREDLVVHEEVTRENSGFTHPQMALTQSFFHQSEMRQKRDQSFKAHNMEKGVRQKHKKRWLKVELPVTVHGMRSAVYAHFLFLLKVKDKDFSSLPEPSIIE